MKAKSIENGLALVGALIVVIGVSSAANTALAEENADITTTALAIHDTARETLADAREANQLAAADAVAALAMENWIDLDIRLRDRTSLIADGRN